MEARSGDVKGVAEAGCVAIVQVELEGGRDDCNDSEVGSSFTFLVIWR